MPAVVNSHSAQLPPGMRRGLTREDCQALQTAGLLELEKFELIDGGVDFADGQATFALGSFASLFAVASPNLWLSICATGDFD